MEIKITRTDKETNVSENVGPETHTHSCTLMSLLYDKAVIINQLQKDRAPISVWYLGNNQVRSSSLR